MPDMGLYRIKVKVLVSDTARSLNEKTEEFIDQIIKDGTDPDLIYISDPAITVNNGRGGSPYYICHTVTYRVLAK